MRRSVNKTIAKPLQDVLTRQHLWQVTQFSTFLNNDENVQSQQVSDSTDETQKAEKCLHFEATYCKYPPGNCEMIHLSGPQTIEKKNVLCNEDRVATTYYNGRSLFNKDEIVVGSNNIYSVVSYHTSSCNPKEFEASDKISSYQTDIENKENSKLNNSYESDYSNDISNEKGLSNIETNDKLRQFKEGVINKIKQGSYTNTSTLNYKPSDYTKTYEANTVKSIEQFPDSHETENEYVRSILNGIPSQNNSYERTYNSKPVNYSENSIHEYYNATNQSKKSDIDRTCDEYDFSSCQVYNSLKTPVQFGVPIKDSKKYSQEYQRNKKSEDILERSTSYEANDDNQFRVDKVPLRLNLKDKGVKYEQIQQDQRTSQMGKDSAIIEGHNEMTIRESENFLSRNYSLRNGYNESDILMQDLNTLSVRDQNFHSSSKQSFIRDDSENNLPDSYRLRNGFTHSKLQDYCTKDEAIKLEYPVYKKGSFGSNFKKYTKNESVPQTQNFSKEYSSNLLNESDITIKSSLKDVEEKTTDQINNIKSDVPKKETLSLRTSNNEVESILKKLIKSDNVKDHQINVSKEYIIDNKFNIKALNEKENSLKKELKIKNNKQELRVTEKILNSNEIGSYYQPDDQNKISKYTQLECKTDTEFQDNGVKNQVIIEAKPRIINQTNSGENDATNEIAEYTKKNVIAETRNLKSNLITFEYAKDSKDDKKENVQVTIVRNKSHAQSSESNTAKTKISESLHHNKPKLGNSSIDSITDGRLVSESYKQKFNKSKNSKLVYQTDQTCDNSEKITLKTGMLRDKTKANSLNNIYILGSKASETQKGESNKIIMKDTQSCKVKVKSESVILRDDKEKSAEVTFPGITPPTFCTPVTYENINKLDPKPKSKADTAGNKVLANKENTNKDILTFSMTGTNDFNFKLGKLENSQSKVSPENKTQMNVKENSPKKETELQANSLASLNSSKTNGKSTGQPLNKKENDDLEARKARLSSVKPELKKLTSMKFVKDKNISSTNLNQFNPEKLANLLKEHRMLLELLLEKLNGRTTPSQIENSPGTKKMVHPPEEKDSDQSANSPDDTSKTENFKKMLTHCIDSQEKVKRLHPRYIESSKMKLNSINLKEEPDKEEDKKIDIAGPTQSFSSNYKWRDIVPPQKQNSKLFINRPLKPFHVITMMTSPSGRYKPKKVDSLLDGNKLAKYNYSPLKQILSQYKLDWSIKPQRLKSVNKTTFLTSPENKKNITERYDRTNWRNFCCASYLNTNEKNQKIGKSKDLSQIKKITILNKKKNYNMRDNIKKRHLYSKNKLQINLMPNLVKNNKKHNSLSKKEEVKAEKDKIDIKPEQPENKPDENNVQVSKGKIFESTKKEFNLSGNKNYSSKCPFFNKEVNAKLVKIKNRSLKNADELFKFIIRPSVNPKPCSSGFERKSNIFNLEYSNNIIKGPMWVVTPEYNHNKVQWNLPPRPDSIKSDTINSKVKINQINKSNFGKTVDIMNSFSKKDSTSKMLSFSSESNLSKPFNVPVLKSSAVPSPLNFFNYKSIHESGTDISKAAGIKKISTCNIKIKHKKSENYKLSNNFSYPWILPSSSTICNNKVPSVSQQDFKELETIKSSADLQTNNLLGLNKNSKCFKYSIERNNSLFGRIRKPDFLKTIKPSFFSFRSISHKDSSTIIEEDSSSQTEEKLNIIPEKKHRNNLFLKSISAHPQIEYLKISWTRFSNKVTHIVKEKCGIDNSGCCKPNFDEMMISISKDIEENNLKQMSQTQKNSCTNKFSKQARSKELALIMENGKRVSRITHSISEPKVMIPQFLEEEVKNF